MESTEEEISQTIKNREKWGQLLQANLQVEGVDDALLDKRTFLGGVWIIVAQLSRQKSKIFIMN